MDVRLISHVNGDGDLLEAWFKYYCRLRISSFHLIVHGPAEENTRLYALKDSYPIVFEDTYEGPFDSREKKRRVDSLLARMRGQWILFVDSDEFVEFPYRTIGMTIRMLRLAGKNALFALMLQHLSLQSSLDTPAVIDDPFRTQPLCSLDLYKQMGVEASIFKYPLFYCTDVTALFDGGNHICPIGNTYSSLQAVTHHFKFRRPVSHKLSARIQSSHPWRHESVGFQQYLEAHGNRLPTDGSFFYSRDELFRRGLLRKFTFATGLRYIRRLARRIRIGENVSGS